MPAREYDARDSFGKGRKRWVGARIFPLKDETDHITDVILIHEDVTDRMLAKKALRESEKKYRLLIENANDAIYIAQDQVLKFANTKTEEMTGYASAELAKMRFVEIVHPDDRGMVPGSAFEKIERRGSSQHLSFQNHPEIRGGGLGRVEYRPHIVGRETR